MEFHLGSLLSNGVVEIDRYEQIVKISSKNNDSTSKIIPYSEINPSNWGYIYERFVGQKYESEGYSVEQVGLKKGFLDGGIDIVVSKENFKAFLQCKFSTSDRMLGKQKIEWVLYNASSFLAKAYEGKRLNLWLVVPCLGMISDCVKSYILQKNDLQKMAKISLVEIPMKVF